jgi:hypothetical protein
VKFWRCFIGGFLLDVTYEDLVPLCLVTLLHPPKNGFDLLVFYKVFGKTFLRVDFLFPLIE